jgi:hypothetical protein
MFSVFHPVPFYQATTLQSKFLAVLFFNRGNQIQGLFYSFVLFVFIIRVKFRLVTVFTPLGFMTSRAGIRFKGRNRDTVAPIRHNDLFQGMGLNITFIVDHNRSPEFFRNPESPEWYYPELPDCFHRTIESNRLPPGISHHRVQGNGCEEQTRPCWLLP